ncbi:hypothetical protein MKZ38_003709 [Zalerion maritima]|uniref:Uncharacterized protein n=1 Tax=Zalerion maritima TaxID=339359 RepID=A0AAD5RWT5_9PEZI|nr:hypothetical protein MKZ38_003709 [Zalerion maritima]
MMWDTIESNYWNSIKSARDREDQKLHEQLQNQQAEIKRALAENYARRTQLTLELTTVKHSIDHYEDRLDKLSEEFEDQKKKMDHDRANDDECQRTFFAKHRSGESDQVPPGVSPQEHADRILAEKRQAETNARQQMNSEAYNANNANNGLAIRNGFTTANGVNGGELLPEHVGVRVVDSEGNLVGEVRRVPRPPNRWIDSLLQIPSKQHAVLRPGRKFTEEQFQSIFEPTDAKAAKWVGVMIQAKGEVQQVPCQYCNKHTGVFGDCVVIGGSDFPRCGNCEWSRQACHFPNASGVPTPIGPKPENGQEVHPSMVPPEYRTSSFVPANQPIPSTEGPYNAMPRAKQGFTAFNLPGVMYPPGEAGPGGHPGQRGPNGPQMQPMVMTGQMPLAPAQHPDQTFGQFPANHPMEQEPKKRPISEDEDEVTLPEITKAGMCLRDNGEIYVEPECMNGVPLRRIQPNDRYWEEEWVGVRETIGPQLQKWNEKLEQIKQNQNTTNAYRFQANRQVNRGNSILKYFDQADFSPYQLVGKKLMSNGIVTYDTLFRLVATLEELKKFSTVDVTPLQWVRQRLCELYDEDRENFNLCKTVHDFYHDKKLVQLRKRNGFGNIGRPSGHKMNREREGGSSANASPAPRAPKKARKSGANTIVANAIGPGAPNSIMSVPTQAQAQAQVASQAQTAQAAVEAAAAAAAAASGTPTAAPIAATAGNGVSNGSATSVNEGSVPPPTAGEDASRDERSATPSGQLGSKPRILSSTTAASLSTPTSAPGPAPAAPSSREEHDLMFDGYTSSDSYSGDKVKKGDWRIYQIKTKDYTSNEHITQYWHWMDGVFEHQVLRDVQPTTSWGLYEDPINFHVKLSEIDDICYAPGSLKIIVALNPDASGSADNTDVLVHFKRERTKRRFLSFCNKKGVRIVKTTPLYVDNAWASTHTDSEYLPGAEENSTP